MPKTLQTKCKTCFGGPRMILYGFWKNTFLKNLRVLFSPALTPPPPFVSLDAKNPDLNFWIFPLRSFKDYCMRDIYHCKSWIELILKAKDCINLSSLSFEINLNPGISIVLISLFWNIQMTIPKHVLHKDTCTSFMLVLTLGDLYL